LKAVGAIVLGLAVALGAGWLWGASGRWDAERQLASARLERELTGARAQLLAARVDLYKLNFGSATSNFEAAKRSLQAGRGALDQDDDAAAIQRLQAATAAAEEARRLAAQVNPAAQVAAERALAELEQAQAHQPR
jgi:hypothetical protein